MFNRNRKRLSAEVFSSAGSQPKQNASNQNREENGSTTLKNTREKPLLAGYGLKMIDLESMIKSLRLAWLKRIFQCNNGAWRNFLRFSLEPFGGLFLFHCNYDFKEISISSKFYSELLQWWSEFRSVFDSRRECQYILWNNKEIRVGNKPVFCKKNFLKKMSFS